MSAMEKSLRRALESGDADDPAFRESIYSASERALERMLSQKAVSEDLALAQRARLAETINRVEDEFYERQTEMGAAEDGPAQHDPTLSLDPAYSDAHAYGTHPTYDGGQSALSDDAESYSLHPIFGEVAPDGRPGTVAMSVTDAGDGEGDDAFAEPVRPSPRARGAQAAREAARRGAGRPRRVLLIVLVLALALGLGAFFVYAATNSGGEEGTAQAGWIGLFDGRRLEALSTPEGGRMEARDGAGAQPSVRFTPAGATSGMEVALGPGVMPDIGGREVMVEIVAGSPDGASRTFSVECRLGGVSACGRRIFTTSRPSETFTFQMDVPHDARAGSIAIASVPGGAADSLDLYSMRLRNG